MKYLVVVAHPDDEVLGAGAFINKMVSEGHEVSICVMSGNVEARTRRPDDDSLLEDMNNCFKFLGVSKNFIGTFPNIKFNTVEHLKLVQFIEKAIDEFEPDVVITHHPSDTNNDHMHTSLACQAAIRLFQRKDSIKPINELWFMEVLSSTEWSVNSSMNRFQPNIYVEIGKSGVEKKLMGLSMYRGVMRDYPHPRSSEAITGLAAYRGGQAGCKYAEAFECVFRRIV